MRSKMKVLIADDDARMRQMLRQTVAGVATDFCEADDGDAAVAAYAAQRPDWVLMDLRMKPTSGLAATRQIKARFPDARILIVTQYDEPDLRRAAQEAGACGYVLKENLSTVTRIVEAASQL